jgi:hypothetical protein
MSSRHMLLLTYTPRRGIDLEAYHRWLQQIDNPFFNSRPAVKHYSNWRVVEPKLGQVAFSHFDLLEIETADGFTEVFGDDVIVAFARDWVTLWGQTPDPDLADQSVNYQVMLCERIAAPEQAL